MIEFILQCLLVYLLIDTIVRCYFNEDGFNCTIQEFWNAVKESIKKFLK